MSDDVFCCIFAAVLLIIAGVWIYILSTNPFSTALIGILLIVTGAIIIGAICIFAAN